MQAYEKSPRERLDGIIINLLRIQWIFNKSKLLQGGSYKEKILVNQILLLQLARIQLELQQVDLKATSLAEKRELRREKLTTLRLKIKAELPPPKAEAAQDEKPTLLVAGSGPLALLTAYNCLLKYHKSFQVILLSDQHIELAVRSGVASKHILDEAMHRSSIHPSSTLVREALTLREHEEISIKHVEMLSLANLKALSALLGVSSDKLFRKGKFSYTGIKPRGSGNSTVIVKEIGTEGHYQIDNVALIFNATGFSGAYPAGFQRKVFSEQQVSRKRTEGVQANVMISLDAFKALDKVLSKYKHRAFCVYAPMKQLPKEARCKLQLFFFWTPEEAALLKQLVCKEITDADEIIFAKIKLWVDFLASQELGRETTLQWDEVQFRRPFKQGKPSACTEFKMSSVSLGHEPMMVNGAGVVSVGDNYLPPLFGESIETGYAHMMEMLEEVPGYKIGSYTTEEIITQFDNSKPAWDVAYRRAAEALKEDKEESLTREELDKKVSRQPFARLFAQHLVCRVDMSQQLSIFAEQMRVKPSNKLKGCTII